MDYEFSQEQQEFRRELRAFLDERMGDEFRGLFGSNAVENIAITRRICEDLAEKGWLTLAWPKEYGGSDGDLWTQMILSEETWGSGEPRGPQYMNLNYIGPLIMRFGTDEQKQRFLPPMAAGKVLWCQGFSEPDAGSDVASLSTRAEDHGDHFVVTGQKIWTSYANAPAEWCLLLVRTNTEVPKHKGISILLVDMKSPGVLVRPIMSMGGLGEINEVFFDNVVVPKENLLGEKDQGWPAIIYGLSFERKGIAMHARAERTINKIIDYAKNTEVNGVPLSKDPRVRAKIAALYTQFRAARLMSYRMTSMVEAGLEPSFEASIAWIHGVRAEQDAAAVGLEIVGVRGQLLEGDADAPIEGYLEREWVEMLPVSIGAGTIDIQRLIIAQRGLGLPKAG